jgi:transposase InsO family protein
MAKRVISMEAKLLAVLTAGLSGMRVTEVCGELGISRQTFYKYRRRFEAEGPAGLVERSRRPNRSPAMMAVDVEDEIVRLRKDLPLDHGAQTIAYHLGRAGWPVPSVSAIHRALVRRGLVTPQPEKRPRSSWRRFEWPQPNDAWQIDGTCWALSSGKAVWIMDLLDDHSRVALAARVYPGLDAEAAWGAFCAATREWGLPAHVMSDNGTCFTGRYFSGGEVPFERDLRALGIRHILSTPGHPQTCGKIERFHQTLKKWLAQQPLARTPGHLQRQLDRFLTFYNHQRPHRALDGSTPVERWAATPPAGPGNPIPGTPRASLHVVANGGNISWGNYLIAVGCRHQGKQVMVIARDDDISLFASTGLIRRFQLDRSRRYQPSGLPPGRKRKIGPCR